MDNVDILVDNLRDILKANLKPCREDTARTEVYCKCPHCSTERSEPHFYIQMKPPFKFYCQKCGYSGILTHEILSELNIFNEEALSIIASLKRKNSTDNKIRFANRIKKIDYTDVENEITKYNLKYFNDRFETNISLEEFNKTFKGIANVPAFLNYYQKVFGALNIKTKFNFYKSIGFISTDNSYLICRDTSGIQKIRYLNIPLSDNENKSKIYNIKNSIDILQPNIDIVITEGIFDVIGLYLKDPKRNTIYSAGCGKSFEKVIMTFIKMGFLSLNIKIFSDNDVNISFYKNIKMFNPLLTNTKIEVFYNTLSKDCGVPASKIKLTKIVI